MFLFGDRCFFRAKIAWFKGFDFPCNLSLCICLNLGIFVEIDQLVSVASKVVVEGTQSAVFVWDFRFLSRILAQFAGVVFPDNCTRILNHARYILNNYFWVFIDLEETLMIWICDELQCCGSGG